MGTGEPVHSKIPNKHPEKRSSWSVEMLVMLWVVQSLFTGKYQKKHPEKRSSWIEEMLGCFLSGAQVPVHKKIQKKHPEKRSSWSVEMVGCFLGCAQVPVHKKIN